MYQLNYNEIKNVHAFKTRQKQRLGITLSLYSTATQNTWCPGLALGNAPNARILRWGYQHVGILQPTQTLASGVKTLASGVKTLASGVICVTPDANPDASQWNIGGVGPLALGLALVMYISCFLC